MTDEEISRFAAMIKESENTVFFGGAGVSTESGIKDYIIPLRNTACRPR